MFQFLLDLNSLKSIIAFFRHTDLLHLAHAVFVIDFHPSISAPNVRLIAQLFPNLLKNLLTIDYELENNNQYDAFIGDEQASSEKYE